MTRFEDGSSRFSGVRVCILRRGPVDNDKRTQQIARLLTEQGAHVTVVSATKTDTVRIMEPGGFTLREVGPLPSSGHRIRGLRIASNLVRNRVREHARHRSLVRAARDASPDIIHCMNVEMLPVGFQAATGRPFIYDSREHFATTGNVSKAVRARWMRHERLYVPQAARVLTVSPPIADDLARRYSVEMPVVIYNGTNTVVGSPSPVHKPLRVLHLGKFFFNRGIEELIEITAALDGLVQLTLQGWGEGEERLRALVRQLGVQGLVTFVPPCSPDSIVAAVTHHDVGVTNIPLDNDNLRWAAANKQFEYMAAGLAQLAPAGSLVGRMIEEDGCGATFEPRDGHSLSEAICRLIEDPDEVARMKRNAVAAAPKYTWDAQAETLYAVYEKALAREGQLVSKAETRER